jgi:hypothetical protein
MRFIPQAEFDLNQIPADNNVNKIRALKSLPEEARHGRHSSYTKTREG